MLFNPQRKQGTRRYHKLFLLSMEGRKTEPEYFSIFKKLRLPVLVQCVPVTNKNRSAPEQVLERMVNYLDSLDKEQSRNLEPYEAWLVIDTDNRPEEQLNELVTLAKQRNYKVAISNPFFEYWLLLHFEDGDSIKSSADCMNRLKKNIPHYDKGIDKSKFTRDMIEQAIHRAEQRDNPNEEWPRDIGHTTVHRLVERILQTA